MSNNFGVYNITGRVESTVSSSFQNSVSPASESMNFGLRKQSAKRDSNEFVNTNYPFVAALPALTSSRYFETNVNTYLSGTEQLERGPSVTVAASGNLYYSKQNRFKKITYKLSASALLPDVPGTEFSPSTLEMSGTRSSFEPAFGSYRSNTYFNPAKFQIYVPEYGKIRDVKVWLEFVNDSRLGPGPIPIGNTYAKFSYNAGSLSGPITGAKTIKVEVIADATKYMTATLYSSDTTNGYAWVGNVQFFGAGVTDVSYFIPSSHSSRINFLDAGLSIIDRAPYLSATFTTQLFSEVGDVNSNPYQGLQNVQIALRSPSTSFKYAHPLWNDSTVSASYKNVDPSAEGSIGGLNSARKAFDRLKTVPELLKNSYLLWAGHAAEVDLGYSLGHLTASFSSSYYDLKPIGSNKISPDVTGESGIWLRTQTPTRDPSSIKTDSNGFPRFAYLIESDSYPTGDYVREKILYGLMTSAGTSSFVIENDIDETKKFDRNITLNLDSSDNSFISYSYWSSASLPQERYSKLAVFPSSSFSSSIETISVGGQGLLSTTIDKNDQIHAAFCSGSFLVYSKRTSPFTWNEKKVTPISLSGSDVIKIMADRKGNPTILYVSSNDNNVVTRATLNENSWVISQLPVTASYGEAGLAFSSMDSTFDDLDNIHIVYSTLNSSNTHHDLYYSFSGSGKFYNSRIFKAGDEFDGLTVTSAKISINKKTGSPIIIANILRSDPNAISGFVYANSIRTFEIESGSTTERIVFDDLTMVESNAHNNKPDSSIVYFYLPEPALCSDRFGNHHIIMYSGSYNGGTPLKCQPVYICSSGSVVDLTQGTGVKNVRVRQVNNKIGMYHSFNTDIDMRTIFSDSSNYKNPRHNRGFSRLTDKLSNTNSYPSPSSASFTGYFKDKNHPVDFITDAFMTGFNVPWMLDKTVYPGYFLNRGDYSNATGSDGTVVATSSFAVPTGWLNGAGGTADTNEWLTRGMQLGPDTIQPVYPLLEDVYAEKIYDEPTHSSVSSFPSIHRRLSGFRPGLRGTEVNGLWQLMIGMRANVYTPDGTNFYLRPGARDGIWFRQLRLEFTIDTGAGTRDSFTNKGTRFKKHANVTGQPGRTLFEVMSGSASWEIGVNNVYITQPDEFGRSIGITSSTGSSDFAVYANLTGSFVDILSGSGQLSNVQSTFLTNEFGTPYIPLSSGSAEIPTLNVYSAEDIKRFASDFQSTLNPRALIPADNTLNAHISRSNILKTTRDIILQKISKS